MKKRMKFGKKIRDLRLGKRMTQRELADEVGIDITYISKLERGQLPPPSERVIRKMAQALECDYEELMLLADKLPPDYASQIRNDPRIADFMRRARSLTPEQWEQIQRVIREGEDGI